MLIYNDHDTRTIINLAFAADKITTPTSLTVFAEGSCNFSGHLDVVVLDSEQLMGRLSRDWHVDRILIVLQIC